MLLHEYSPASKGEEEMASPSRAMDMEASAPELKNNEAKSTPPRKERRQAPWRTIMAAFVDAGGKDYLVKVAKTDPRTFCRLLGKILPTQVTGNAADEPVRVQVSWLTPALRPIRR